MAEPLNRVGGSMCVHCYSPPLGVHARNCPSRAPKTCPDCKRPRKVLGGCIIRAGDSCVRAERDRLRLELAAVEKLNAAERAVIEAAEYFCGPDSDKTDESCFLRIEDAVDRMLALRAEANHG